MASAKVTPDIPKILVANGVNLDLLGKREPSVYGSQTLSDLEDLLSRHGESLAKIMGFKGLSLSFYQSNVEADFLSEISRPFDGALINPAAWTHTSLALGDRLAALELPFVEIHISHVSQREDFRQRSYCAASALGIVSGLGFDSYLSGLLGLLAKIQTRP